MAGEGNSNESRLRGFGLLGGLLGARPFKRRGSHRARVAPVGPRATVEPLEDRLLLSSTQNSAATFDSAAILSAVPSGSVGVITAAGLQISDAPLSDQYTPSYVLLDPNPQVSSDGVIVPFSTAGPTGMTAAKMRHAYGLDQVMFGTIQGNGAGQTIAIIDAYDYPTVTTDLHNFDLAFGLPDAPSLVRVNEDGGSTLPGTDPAAKGNDWEVESSLDVEWAHAMAPMANILLVEANAATDSDLIQHAVNYARSAPGVVAVTMSFGKAEVSTETALDSYFTTPAGHGGVTFLASTGDSGVPGGYPSKSPNVVAVGGTTLNVDASGNYISESAWSSGGGGLSTFEAQPAYQSGIVTQSTTQRATPDVALDADPATGASVYDTYDFGTSLPWMTIGGTSLSSPAFAGIISVMDQGRGIGGVDSMDGFSNTLPRIYALPQGDFHDITTGNNGSPAGVGYDLATGRGSPIATVFVPQLSASGPFVVSSSPTGVQMTAPGAIDFNFSGAMDPTSFSYPADVDSFTGPGNVNLISSITGFSWLNGNTTLHLTFTKPSDEGLYSVSIGPQILAAGGAAMDQNQNALTGEPILDQYTTTFAFDTNPLVVTSTSPAIGGVVTNTLDVTFNREIDPSSAAASNLTLSQGTVVGVTVLSGNTTVRYTLTGINSEGSLNVSIAAGALTEPNGNPLSAPFGATYMLDIVTAAFPTPFVPVGPIGSEVYTSPTVSGVISPAGDTDSYTVDLDAGQQITVVATGAGGLRPLLQLLDPGNNLVATAAGPASGQDAVIQAAPVNSAGIYTVVISGAVSTTGAYTITASLNATAELEAHFGAANDTILTAQNLDNSFRSLPGGGQQEAVLGTNAGNGGSTSTDYFSVSLVAGVPATFVLENSGGGADGLTLLNSNGSVLAQSVAGFTNVDKAIVDFVPQTSGLFEVLVNGNSTVGGYLLLAMKNADFNLEPDDTNATAQALGQVGSVAGAIGQGANQTTDLETFDSGNVNAYTFTVTNNVSVTAAAAHDGPFGMATNSGITDWMYRNDAAAHVARGTTLSVWVRATAAGVGRAYFGFGATSAGSLSVVMALNTSNFIIDQNPGYGFDPIATDNQTWQANKWYRIEAVWQSNGTIVANLYDTDGTTLLNTLTAVDSTVSSGGIAFRAFGAVYNFDTARLVAAGPPGTDSDVYSIQLSAGQTVHLSTSTPGGGGGEFTNLLDPALDVYDSVGNIVASNDNGANDGRNARLSFTAAASGKYFIRVYSSPANVSAGEYVLNLNDQAISLAVPANVMETDGAAAGTINLSVASATDLLVTLSSSDPGRVSVPATVTIPAGQTSVPLPLSIIDNSLLDGPEQVTISASVANYAGGSSTIIVHDNETAGLTVNLSANITEGGSVGGTITSSAAPDSDITVQLSSSNSSILTVPATVILKAGTTSVNFTATAPDNKIIEGNLPATVTASVENWTSGAATTTVADIDNVITVAIPVSGFEGQTFANGGTVKIGGTLTTPLTVTLLSSDTTALSVPATVTIPAGQLSVSFNVTLVDDGLKSGTRTPTLTASAAGLVSGNASMAVHDSTLDHLAFNPIAGPKTAAVTFPVTIQAFNIANEVIPVFNVTGALSAAGQSGSLPISITTATITAGVFTGSLSVNAVDPNVTLTFAASQITAASNVFAVQPGPVANFLLGTIGSPQYANNPFPATITARDANGFTANFNGVANLGGLTGATQSGLSMLGSPAFNDSNNSGSYTVGYAFTPTSNLVVTAVRSYFGSKVSIWTNTGTLLASQAVSGTAATWTDTSLSTPLQLTAGVTYRVSVYTNAKTYYWRSTAPANPTFATLGQNFEGTGDTFPTTTDTAQWWMVDLRVNVLGTVPITPTTATFVNGVWTGNVAVLQVINNVHLHSDDGLGHSGDSNVFNVLQPSLLVQIPANINETDGTVNGTLAIAPVPGSDLTVSLTSSDPSRLTVPASITIPAGQSSVQLPLTAIDDLLLNGPETVTISATAAGYLAGGGTITIHDNETATLSVNLPISATEGDGSITGTVTSSAAPSSDITVQLASNLTSRLTVPASVVLKAGTTSVNFLANVIDNTIIDGSATVTVTASTENWTSGSTSIIVIDNDAVITVTLPASGFQGQTFTNGGTVKIGGTLTSPLIVNLFPSDSTALSVPATVTIPAGQLSVNFNVTLVNDGVKAGTRTLNLAASAPGLDGGSASITVHNATVDHLAFGTITGPKTAAVTFPVTIQAFNIANEVITNFSGTALLSATGQAGNLPISLTTATFASGVFSGNLSVNAVDPAVMITAATGGVSASSSTFAVQGGAVASFLWGAVTSPQYVNNPFPATITAKDANGFVATFNGTANLSGLTGATQNGLSMLGSPASNDSNNSGTYTVGYAFTPTSNLLVTAVRNYFGSKVSIWTDSGTLLASQAVSGTAATWTDTSLSTPLQLTAGVTYRVTVYTNAKTYYWRSTAPANSTFATLGQNFEAIGDTFPTTTDTAQWWMVDLRVNAGVVPISPTTATFVNGVWNGNVTVLQPATNMHLHSDDGSSHVGDSNTFNVLQRFVSVQIPANANEGDGTINGTLGVTPAPLSDLTVNLSSSDPSRLTVPATITIPAGQTSMPLPLTVIDDTLLNGPESITITAAANLFGNATGAITVHDNETAALSVNLPASATEGDGSITGTVTSSAAPSTDITVQLGSNLASRLTVPASVVLKAGTTSVNFLAGVIDDTIIDGTQAATVTASVENWTSGSATTNINDNDNFIVVTLPASGFEGQAFTNGGTVKIGGTLSSPLTVTLLPSDSTALSVPATVTIPAGQLSVSFNVTLVNDGLKAGTRTPTLTASATGLAGGSASIIVHDATLDHLAFNTISSPQVAGVPFSILITAFNVANEVITVFNGPASLSASGQGGSLPVVPGTQNFFAGVLSINLSVNAADPTVTLAAASGGVTGFSNAFVVNFGPLAGFKWSSIGSTQYTGIPFAATITAVDSNGITTNFSGTANLSGLLGSTSSQTITGNITPNSTGSGAITAGYSFTPNVAVTVTVVRAYFGTKVSIWTDGGTLLLAQSVPSNLGTWTETTLSTPLALSAGVTYRVAAFTSGTSEYKTSFTPSFSWGAYNGAWQAAGDAFPNVNAAATPLVDLRVQASSGVSISPVTAAFVNGVWTGNVAVLQTATAMHLHLDDLSGHLADSSAFNVLQSSLSLSIPANATEGAGTVNGTLSVVPTPLSDLVVNLSSSDPTRLTVPATITIPANQSSVPLPLTVIDDSLLNGPEQVMVTATPTGYPSATGTITIHDNETASLSVNLPAGITEGSGGVTGTVTSSAAPSRDITVQLANSNSAVLSVPSSVILKAGTTSVDFTATAPNNNTIEGDQPATVTASFENWTSGAATTTVVDINNQITVTLPASGWEGQTLTNVGTVTIGGKLATALTVTFSSSDTTALAVPANVTIAAGKTSATFSVTLVNDGVKAGTRNATLTASATGLVSGSANIAVHDSTLDHVVWASIPSPQTTGTLFNFGLTACNIANETITTFFGTAIITATGQSGPIQVGGANNPRFSQGICTNQVSVNASDPAVTLTADLGGGIVAFSNVFAVQPAAAPAVIINDGSPQRSMVTSITVAFAAPMILGDGAITLATAGGDPVPFHQASADGQTYLLTFPNGVGQSLADGQYILTVHASAVTDLSGNALSNDLNFGFYRLYGDYSGDGKVGFNDLVQLIQNFNVGANSINYQSNMDMDGSGDIGFADLVGLVQNFNKSLSAPQTAALAAGTPDSSDNAQGVANTLHVIASPVAPTARSAPAIQTSGGGLLDDDAGGYDLLDGPPGSILD